MGRTAAVRPTGSQPTNANVLYRAGQSRIQQIDSEIVSLNAERRELVTACQGFGGTATGATNATWPSQPLANLTGGTGTGNPPTMIRRRKPMSAAHKAKLREAALTRKQVGTAAAASTAAPTSTTGRGKKPATMAAAG